jgi:hypothetical protein
MADFKQMRALIPTAVVLQSLQPYHGTSGQRYRYTPVALLSGSPTFYRVSIRPVFALSPSRTTRMRRPARRRIAVKRPGCDTIYK